MSHSYPRKRKEALVVMNHKQTHSQYRDTYAGVHIIEQALIVGGCPQARRVGV